MHSSVTALPTAMRHDAPTLLYKPHGPVAPGPGDPQAPVAPLKSLCFLWFSRVGEGGGRKLEMFLDAAGVFWAAEAG